MPSLGAPVTMLVQKAMLSIPLWAGLRVQFSEGKLFPSESSRGPSSLSPGACKQVCGSNVIVEAWEGQEALSSVPRRAGLGVTLRGKGAVADEKGSQVVLRTWAGFNTQTRRTGDLRCPPSLQWASGPTCSARRHGCQERTQIRPRPGGVDPT